MLICEYYSDANEGMLKPFMPIEETRKVMKSCNIHRGRGTEPYECEEDFFTSTDIRVRYDVNHRLKGLGFSYNSCSFKYKCINLFTEQRKLEKELIKNKIIFKKTDDGIELEGGRIGIYIRNMDMDPNDEDYEEPFVEAVCIEFEVGPCSVSFRRLISNHIPSKKTYEGSKKDPMDGPAIRMDYYEQKYFASHGNSKAAKHYRELQRKLISEGKLMEAIKKDMEDIKNKTGAKYTQALKEMLDYAIEMEPKDFIKK